jgi:hypothetical protein
VTRQDVAGDGVVTIRRDIRRYDYQVPDDTLGWKRAPVNFRPKSIHEHADPPIRWEHSPLVPHIEDRIVKQCLSRFKP